jgi:hypothetical protein
MTKKKTENVVRPIAHWEQADYSYVDLDNGGVQVKVAGIGCSNCMATFRKNFMWAINFCPNCGARMEAVEE